MLPLQPLVACLQLHDSWCIHPPYSWSISAAPQHSPSPFCFLPSGTNTSYWGCVPGLLLAISWKQNLLVTSAEAHLHLSLPLLLFAFLPFSSSAPNTALGKYLFFHALTSETIRPSPLPWSPLHVYVFLTAAALHKSSPLSSLMCHHSCDRSVPGCGRWFVWITAVVNMIQARSRHVVVEMISLYLPPCLTLCLGWPDSFGIEALQEEW